MIYIFIALAIGMASTLVFLHKPIIRLVAEKKAIPKIENTLFNNKEHSKSNVLDEIHELTNNRLSDELIMDYFYKIKGLQVLNNSPISFWVKIYLTTPTKIKLNYFEQVRFYETFLNYPKIDNNSFEDTEKKRHEMRINNFRASVKKRLSKKIISQRLA